MPGGLLTMSAKELDRLGVVRRVVEGRLPQKQAALMLGVTPRQARRLCEAYEPPAPPGWSPRAEGSPATGV
jgi:hypothetical protein